MNVVSGDVRDLVGKVLVLSTYLKSAHDYGNRVRTYELGVPSDLRGTGAPGDLLMFDFNEREPETSWALSPSTGRVVEHTCQYSGHNGDSYGDRWRLLGIEESRSVLESIFNRLYALSLREEEQRLRRGADARLLRVAEDNLQVILSARVNLGEKEEG